MHDGRDMTAGAGDRSSRRPAGWVPPKTLKRATIALLALAVVAAATLSGSGG